MSSNTYYIIGAIAVVFVIYLIVLKTMKQRQLDKFKNSHSGKSLTEQQKRLLTFGAVLSYHRSENILGILPERGLNEYVAGLKTQWEITNTEDAKHTLNELLQLKRSTEFESLLQQPSAELADIQQTIAKGLGIDITTVAQTKSAYAWDICRAVALAKWCYWSGYLTEEETYYGTGCRRCCPIR